MLTIVNIQSVNQQNRLDLQERRGPTPGAPLMCLQVLLKNVRLVGALPGEVHILAAEVTV